MVNVHRAKVFCQISHPKKVQLLLDKGYIHFSFVSWQFLRQAAQSQILAEQLD